MTFENLKIIILEDNESDAALLVHLLKKSYPHCDCKIIMTRAAYEQALDAFKPDIILSDNEMPQFAAADALQILQQKQFHIPFILVTGTVSEEFAAGIIKAGADDYLLKDRLMRLPAAIDAALRKKQTEIENKQATEKLKQSEEKYRNLIDQASDGIFIADITGKCIEVNEIACRATGYSKDEFTGLELKDLLLMDNDPVPPRLGEINLEKPIIQQRTIRRKDGTSFPVEISAKLMQDGNYFASVRDLTERFEAEKKLAQSQERFRALIENSNDTFTLLNESLKPIYRSPSTFLVTGWTNEEIENSDAKQFIHPDDLSKTAASYMECLSSPGIPVKSLIRSLHKDGHYMWMEGSVTNLLHDVNIQSVVLNFRNVTERVQAEEKLSASQNRFRALIENSNDAILLLDESMKIIYRSEAAARITGWPNDVFTNAEATRNIHPDDLEYFKAKFEESVRTPEIVVHHLIRYHHAAGHYIWSEGTFSNLLHVAEVNAIVVNYRDITERKKAEVFLSEEKEKFTKIAATSPGLIYSMRQDKHGVLSYPYASDAVKDIYGFAFEEIENAPEKIFSLIHKDDAAGVMQSIKNTKTNMVPLKGEYRYQHPTKGLLWHEVNSLPVRETDGAVVCHGIIVDITERKKTDELLKAERDKLANIAAASPGLIFSYKLSPDGSTSMPFASAAIENILGYTHSSVEKDAHNAMRFTHADDLPNKLQALQLSAQNLTPWNFVFRHHHPTRGMLWLEASAMPKKEADGSIIWHGVISDITERKKAESLLNEEREKLLVLSDTVPGVIYSFCKNDNNDYLFTYASNAVQEIFGIQKQELLADANHFFRYIHPGDIDRVSASIELAIKLNSDWTCEFRYLHPVKNLVWLEGSSRPLESIDNTMIWHGIINDVTQKKLAEQKLIKANRLYAFISQINQLIVRTTDEQTLFKEACNIAVDFGKFKMAWIGMIDERTNQVIPLEFSGNEDGYLSAINTISVVDVPEGRGPTGTAIREGRHIVCNDIEADEAMASWKDTAISRGYLSSISLPIKKSGEIIGAFSLYAGEKDFFDADEIELLVEATGDISFALDVFENQAMRKKAQEAVIESEQRYQTLTEIAPVGIFHTDAAGITTYVNPNWCIMSGLSSAEALGNGWLSAVHPEDRQLLQNEWQKATDQKETSFTEYRFVRPDGSIAWVMGLAIPEKNSDEQVVGYVGTITDITEHKLAQDIIVREKQLSESIINNLPGIFYLYDESGKFIRWNKNFENVSAYTGNEIAAMNPVDFYDEDQKDKIRQRIQKVYERNASGIEVEIFTKNKNKIPYYINSIAIDYEGNKCILGMGLDLTERKIAEAKLTEQKAQLQILSNNLPGVTLYQVIRDQDGSMNFSYISNKITSLAGKTPEELYRTPAVLYELIIEEDRPKLLAAELESYNNMSLFNVEVYCNNYKNERRCLNIISFPRKLSDGRIAWDGFYIDITERKKNEELLIANEKRFRKLVENGNDAFVILDASGKPTYVSSSVQGVLGYTEEEVLSMDMFSLVHPEHVQKVQDTHAIVMANPGVPITNHISRLKHKDGTWHWYEDTITNLLDDPDICGIVDNFRDITERITREEEITNSEEKRRLIMSAALDAIICMDTTGRITFWNPQAEVIFGWKEEEVMGRLLSEIIIPEQFRKMHESGLRNYLKTGKGPALNILLELTAINRKLEAFPVELTVLPINQGGEEFFCAFVRDITHRKNAETAIKASEEKYRVLVEEASEGIFISDSEGRFLTVNTSACRISQYTEAELLQMTIFDFFTEDELRERPLRLEELKLGKTVIAERVMKRKDGQLNYLEITSKLLTDGRLLSLVRDVAERKKAQEALMASEEKYRTLVEQATDGIFIADSNGKFIIVNTSGNRISGYSTEELMGMTIYDLVQPENLANFPFQFEEMKKPEGARSERKILRKDGSVLDVEISAKFLSDMRFIAFVSDISERKKAEESILLSNERYNLVSKATNDSIWDFNIVTGTITRTGDGFKTLFGYDLQPPDNHDLHWTKLIHPEDLPRVKQSQDCVFNNPEEFYWEQEYRFLKADGQYAYVDDKGYIIRDVDGRAIRMIGATQDITRLRENEKNLTILNKDLQAQAKELADSYAELEQFAYVASHDLQEPLRMVTSFLLLLEKNFGNNLDEKAKQYINFAVDGAKRMRQIILDLLELSRVGRKEGDKEMLQFHNIILETQLLFVKEIEEKNVSIHVEADEHLVIHTYRSPLLQIFQNLVGNAIKYKRESVPAKIIISATSLPDFWRFCVTDNGIGIEKEYFDRIFVVFQRLHNKNEFSGTGIGLSITKKIVESLGGKIWLESEPGKGSSFYFTIKK